MGSALSGHGSILSFQSPPGGAFVELGELGDISAPGLMRNEFDATAQNADIDEWVVGVLRREPVSIPVFFNKAVTSHTQLRDLLIAGTKTGFKLEFPDGDSWVGSGFVRQIAGPSAPVDGLMTATVTVRLTGAMLLNGVTIS